MENENPLGLRMAAHSLKSNGIDFGAQALAQVCRKLEYMGREGTVQGATPLIQQANQEFDKIIEDLLAIRDGKVSLTSFK